MVNADLDNMFPHSFMVTAEPSKEEKDQDKADGKKDFSYLPNLFYGKTKENEEKWKKL